MPIIRVALHPVLRPLTSHGDPRRLLTRTCAAVIAVLFAFQVPSFAGSAPSDPLLQKPAPLFVRRDLKRNQLDLAALHGKVILLTFWATWCAPCQLEMPYFVQWQSKYAPQGFQIVGVSMDDDAAPVRAIVARKHLNYPIIMGDEKLGMLYGGILGLPVTYLIDRDGVIRAGFQGETDPQVLEKAVLKLLARH